MSDPSAGASAHLMQLAPLFSAVVAWEREDADHAKKFVGRVRTSWVPAQAADVKRNQESSHHFSPLREISIKETDHSRLLGQLLNPRANHGQGRLFLDSFLELLEVEDPHSGEWRVDVEKEGVDILLSRHSPRSVIIIENKANSAADQEGQLYRYWHQQVYRRFPALNYDLKETGAAFKVVYAPVHVFARPDEQSLKQPREWQLESGGHEWMPLKVRLLSFKEDIGPWLAHLAEAVPNARLQVFLTLYSEIWTSSKL